MMVRYKLLFALVSGVFLSGRLPVGAQVLVKDIRPGPLSSAPEQLFNHNGKLYFVADDGVHGKELWQSNGTSLGTVLVKDIVPGTGPGNVQQLTSANGSLFFRATDAALANQLGGPGKLWKSDGTAAGTIELHDAISNPLESINPVNLTNVGGTLYYTNTLALGGISQSGLLTSNGTDAPGTQIIRQLPIEPPRFSKPSQLTNLNGTLYFMYAGALWKSDGTNAGTVLVKTISPGPEDTKIQSLINVAGTLFFSVDDGNSSGVRRLWKSDGTAAGTVKLKDGIGNPGEGPNPTNLTNVKGTLYYTSTVSKGGYGYWGLFKSDGTDYPGTQLVGTFVKSSNDLPLSGNDIPYASTASQAVSPSNLIHVNGTLYFVFAGNLWKSNGTAASTVKVVNAAFPSSLTDVKGTLYFVRSRTSIYKTTPATSTSTSVVSSGRTVANLTYASGLLFYTTNNPATGTELYALKIPVKSGGIIGDWSLPRSR